MVYINTFHVLFVDPPTLSTTPIDLTLPEKHIATFHCIALGNPVPKITWSKDGDTVGTGNTLRFEVQRKDSGKYLCTADNGLSTTVNASAYLNVLCKCMHAFMIKVWSILKPC